MCYRKDQQFATVSGTQRNVFFSFVFIVVIIGYIISLFLFFSQYIWDTEGVNGEKRQEISAEINRGGL